METSAIRNLAIKRHDIDASYFQKTYEQEEAVKDGRTAVFLYGRAMLMDELAKTLNTLPQGAHILDVGCGTGHLTKWMQDKGFKVTGLEPSSKMIGYARKNYPDINFVEGISSDLPFEAEQFDLIIAIEVLRYLNEEENMATYEAFKRVLKPNGKFFVTHVNKWATDGYRAFYFAKGLVYKLLNKTYHYCYFTSPAQEEQNIKEAGFTKAVTLGRLTASTRFMYKFGKSVGDKYTKLAEKWYGKQHYISNPQKSMAGHLIVIGHK